VVECATEQAGRYSLAAGLVLTREPYMALEDLWI
jgi:hypothetical protein